MLSLIEVLIVDELMNQPKQKKNTIKNGHESSKSHSQSKMLPNKKKLLKTENISSFISL
jgi:hypothetical protein